ncbi:MAG: CpaF family protein [Proteobacteria bacterium]|nr:CpaF family protein [Pseudomonadota bacterium]
MDSIFHSTGEPLLLPVRRSGSDSPQRGSISEEEAFVLRQQIKLADAIRKKRLAPGLSLKQPLDRTPERVEKATLAIEANLSRLELSTKVDKDIFVKRVLNEIFGLGPLEHLMAQERLTEVMVNGPWNVFVEKDGKMFECGHKFLHDEHVERVIQRIVRPLGRVASADNPFVDARLSDGSRVNAVLPPCGINGPSITIRRFLQDMMTMKDLVSRLTLSPSMATFLEALVKSRHSIIVSGGTGSGKTTLVNALSRHISDDERIVVVEDAAELQLTQRNVICLETKLPTIDSPTRICTRDCVINALRMRPDRIIVGECRSGEALDMLQAMNTGHDGSMTTIHANSPRDCLSRLETCVLMSGVDLPIMTIRRQVVSAVQYIVQLVRHHDGSRKISHVTECCRMEGEVVILNDIFVCDEHGRHQPTGNRPSQIDRLTQCGFKLPTNMFLAR